MYCCCWGTWIHPAVAVCVVVGWGAAATRAKAHLRADDALFDPVGCIWWPSVSLCPSHQGSERCSRWTHAWDLGSARWPGWGLEGLCATGTRGWLYMSANPSHSACWFLLEGLCDMGTRGWLYMSANPFHSTCRFVLEG